MGAASRAAVRVWLPAAGVSFPRRASLSPLSSEGPGGPCLTGLLTGPVWYLLCVMPAECGLARAGAGKGELVSAQLWAECWEPSAGCRLW